MHILPPAAYVALAMTVTFADGMDILSGNNGWVGAGILGMVLFWLLYVRWPANDRQTEKLIETRDSLVRELNAQHMKATADQDRDRREDFKASLDLVIAHCDKETNQSNRMLEGQLIEFSKVIVDLRTVMEEAREDRLAKVPPKS